MRFKSEEKSHARVEFPRKWSNSLVGMNGEEKIPPEEILY